MRRKERAVSSCVCSIDAADIGFIEFAYGRTVIARKEHICGECGVEIQPGEKYERFTGKCEGDIFSAKTCLLCVEVRDCFCCSYYFGAVWEHIQDYALGLVAAKVIVLFFGCEVLIRELRGEFKSFAPSAVAALAVIAIRGLL